MRNSLLLLCLVPLLATAQQQVKFLTPDALLRHPGLMHNKTAIAGLQAAGITAEQQELVLQYSDPKYWPVGIRTDSARTANAPYLQNYSAFRVCSYQEDSLLTTIIMVPAQENIHMPEDLRPLADVYLLVADSALKAVPSVKKRPVISRGPSWKNLSKAKIVKPDDLYATYDLGRDSVGLAALAKNGMSPAEIDAVVFRSHERNWPDGIDSFDERYPRLEDYKKYKAYLGAKWEDKVLLIIPVEKNKKMPVVMRPYVDLYFVYSAAAVEVKKGRKKK